MKVEVNDKIYCVETLIADNERLRKEIIESAKTNRLVLDSVRAEIEIITNGISFIDKNKVFEIIDKYKTESEE